MEGVELLCLLVRGRQLTLRQCVRSATGIVALLPLLHSDRTIVADLKAAVAAVVFVWHRG